MKKLYLITPSGKTLQSKINSMLRYYAGVEFNEDQEKNLVQKEEQIKASVACLLRQCFLNAR